MANILKQKLKHGIFSFYDNDKYVGKSLSEYGEWSESEVELIKGLVTKNEVIIEIGSNIGTHTVPLAKHLSNGGKIYAFEPQSQNRKLLEQNIKDNDIENVQISKIAISSKEGKAYMNTFANDKLSNYGDARIFRDEFDNSECVQVKTLDEFFYNNFDGENSVRLIKFDVQGQELNVIIGSEKLINEYKPILYLENDNIETSKKLIDKIKSLGYIMFWHLPALFNPNNYLKNSENIFSNIISCNMFCIHLSTKISLDESWKDLQIKDSNFHPFKKKS
ncbi:MAG: FkbM family methyltransferase [Candidatus Pelagibacter sp.]